VNIRELIDELNMSLTEPNEDFPVIVEDPFGQDHTVCDIRVNYLTKQIVLEVKAE
jgi:hypothetical protein